MNNLMKIILPVLMISQIFAIGGLGISANQSLFSVDKSTESLFPSEVFTNSSDVKFNSELSSFSPSASKSLLRKLQLFNRNGSMKHVITITRLDIIDETFHWCV